MTNLLIMDAQQDVAALSALGAGSKSDPYVLTAVVHGTMAIVSAEYTRLGGGDVTPYIAGDVINVSTSVPTFLQVPGVARIAGGFGYIVGAALTTDKKSITPRIRVHLFNVNTATVSGDNLPHRELYADIGKRLRFFDLPAMTTAADVTNSDMSRSADMALRIPFKCAAGATSIFVLLETLDAFVPASAQKFTLTLNVDQD